MSVWDTINDLTQFKKGDYTEKDYNAFLVNRSLSMHPDTILFADDMNYYRHLDTRLQFDYYFHSVRSKKRFGGKWPKPTKNDDLKLVADFYGFGPAKARAALMIMDAGQLDELRKRTEKGGVKE